jgi:hypothetical protein
MYKIKIIYFVILITILLISCKGSKMTEKRIRERVILFSEYIEERQYDLAWEMLHEDFKSKQNWTKDSFRDLCEGQESFRSYKKLNGINFDSVEIIKKNGITFAKVTIKAIVETTNKRGENVKEERTAYYALRFENNDWFIILSR